MSEVEFVDTNVLVYAHARRADRKCRMARELVARLWNSGRGAVSTQVLGEFFVVATRKITPPLTAAAARQRASWYSRWTVVQPTAQDVLDAIDLSIDRRAHFWDAFLVVAAQRAGAGLLWSEDLQAGARFGGVVVKNPFTGEIPALHEDEAEYRAAQET